MQEVSEGARGEVGGRGEAEGEKVSRVCAHGAACRSEGIYGGRRLMV